MKGLDRRLGDLERRTKPQTRARHHWIIINIGDSIEAAQAQYQVKNGAIAPSDNWTIWEIIDPIRSEAE